jgi:hypothetical protein
MHIFVDKKKVAVEKCLRILGRDDSEH